MQIFSWSNKNSMYINADKSFNAQFVIKKKDKVTALTVIQFRFFFELEH